MEETITLQEIIKILRKRLLLIISLTLVAVGVAAVISFYILTPVYEAQTQILVNQNSNSQEVYSWQSTETDLQLINTYNVIIKSPAILNKVIEELELDLTPEQLTEKVTVTNESDSKVVNIIVEDKQPKQSVEIANTIADVFKEEIPKLMSVDNINILSKAKLSENPNPVKPNEKLNMVIAAVIGVMAGVGLAFLLEVLDTTIKSEKDIEEIIQLPIMGLVSSIPQDKFISSIPSRKARRNS